MSHSPIKKEKKVLLDLVKSYANPNRTTIFDDLINN